MEETKKDKKPAPVCKCGKTAKHHVYSTFEYFYCADCKTEVKEEEKPKKNPWGSWRGHELESYVTSAQQDLIDAMSYTLPKVSHSPKPLTADTLKAARDRIMNAPPFFPTPVFDPAAPAELEDDDSEDESWD